MVDDTHKDGWWKLALIREFPGLKDVNSYRIIGPQNDDINCLAMVLNAASWLDPPYGEEETLEYFTSRGYEVVKRGEPVKEGDIETYELGGIFTHVHICINATRARSKMGIDYYIEHDRDALDGGGYGKLLHRFRKVTSKKKKGKKSNSKK